MRRQLHQARIESRLTLEQIAMRTALSASVLRHLDEGRFELLPAGLYARAYVRAFAAEVGLDPEATLADLEHLLPGTPDPLPVLIAKEQSASHPGAGLLSQLPESMSALLSTWTTRPATRLTTDAGITQGILPGLPHSLAGPERFAGPRAAVALARPAAPMARGGVLADVVEWLRVHTEPLNDTLSALRPKTLLRPGHPRALVRCGAAAIDALVLVVVDAFLLLLISWSSGIPVQALLSDAGWALAAFCAVPIALYFLLFGGVGGSTLGRYVCSLVAPHQNHPLTLPDIIRRALVGR